MSETINQVKVNNTWFNLDVIKEQKKEQFSKENSGNPDMDVEDCWNQLQALLKEPKKK